MINDSDNKIKVLHVLNSNSYSGAENVVLTIINATKDCVNAAYTSPNGKISEYLHESKVTYYPLNNKFLKLLKLIKIVKIFKPDIIHAHDFTTSLLVSLMFHDIPIINHLHNNSPWLKTYCLKAFAYLFAAFKADRILTVSDSVMKEYIFGHFFENKTMVVGNPVDVNLIRKKAEKAEINDSSDIVYLGRLSEPKNPLLFLDIISNVVKIKPYLKVAMVGNGELEKLVKTKAKELNLNRNICFYGFIKNPLGLLKNSKILCMPSLWEGFGLAAVEALALGKPVIAAPVGGLINIIQDNICGKFCNNLENYVDSIIELLGDRYPLFAENASKRSEQFNNIDSYINNLCLIYRDIVKKR